MTRVAILDQEHPLQPTVSAAKGLQFPDVVFGVLRGFHGDFHPPRVHDQEQQEVDCPMARVLKLLPFDEARDRPPDRTPLQHLKVGHLIDGYGPEALAGQSFRISVAPQHLLGPLLELGVQARSPPVAGAVWLQVHVVQDPLDRTGTDGVHDAIGDGLAGQIRAGPVRDVQSLGDRFQASQFDDLGALEGGEISWGRPT